jgi:hypothetical protein
MTNISVTIFSVIIFFVKIYLLNAIRDFIFSLINKIELILKQNKRGGVNDDMSKQIFNVVFIFGIIYAKIMNYINGYNLI